MKIEKYYWGHGLAAGTVLVWGTTFIATKLLLADFMPIEIALIRFVLAFLFLNIIMPKRLHVREKGREKYFVLAGITGITLYFMTENVALLYTTAANVGVIISTVPFFTAIVSRWFFGGNKLTKNFLLGFLVAMLGIMAISYNGVAELALNPMGDLLTLAAASTWAFYSNFVNKISQWGLPMIQVTRRIFFYGILFLIPFAFFMPVTWEWNRFTNGMYIGNFIFLGILASGIGFVTWNQGVKILGTVKSSIYLYMSPVITIIVSAIVLQEPMTIVTILGTGLTILGLIISGKGEREENEGEKQSI